MRKWLIAFLAGAVVVGCTGGSGGVVGTGSPLGGTTGTPGRLLATVSLPSRAAQANIVILTGQGRRSSGDNYATFNLFQWGHGTLDVVPTVFQGSLEGVPCNLGGYSMNTVQFSQDLGDGVLAKNFTNLFVQVWGFANEDQFGHVLSQYQGLPVQLPPLPIDATLVAGRQTTVQTYLNDSSVGLSNGQITFDQTGWNNDNLPGGLTALPGFLSDFVSFDLTPMADADKPSMQVGGVADKAMFTGDQTGVARGTKTVGSFDLYSKSFVESGVLTPPVTIGGAPAPGTYNVYEPDPRFGPTTTAPIVAVQGIWRSYADVLTNVPGFTMLVLPTTKASGLHQVVAFNKSGAGVSALWYGTATLGTDGTGTVSLSPIKELGSPTTLATGKLGTFTVTTGAVADGKFTMNTPPVGWPFPTTGDFVVFR